MCLCVYKCVRWLLDPRHHTPHHTHTHTTPPIKGENGGRADTRWAALQDPSTGSGLLLRCAPAPVAPESVAVAAAEARALDAGAGQSAVPGRFQFNAGMHTVGEVEAAGHVHELREWEDGGLVGVGTTI